MLNHINMTDVNVEDPLNSLVAQLSLVGNTTDLEGDLSDLVNITHLDERLMVIKENMDVFFILIISFIVFFLQAGFAFLEVGAVRSKNATNILIKNMLDVFLGGIAFWLVGYPIAFGTGNGWIGTTYWASAALPDLALAHWCFQFVFAATSATIVSGSVAERCSFNAYFIYSIMLTGFVYPVIAHWAWSGDGWLGAQSYHDFAGSGVVHLTGGVSALVGAIMLGPRIGRFGEGGCEIRGHSVPLAGLGGFILLFGFLAFNGGSQGSISNPGDAATVARAVVNTIISGCCGGLSVLLAYRAGGTSTWSFLMTLNGALAGMVSICSGCDVQRPWGGMVTGSVAGLVFLGIHYAMIKLKVDDPLDAVAVHMGGGMWGLIATSLFMDDGIVYGNAMGVKVLTWNLAGMATIILWAGGFCTIMFGLLRVFKILRVPEEMEIKGMDILKHGEPAYPVDSWIEEQYYAKFHDRNQHARRHSGLPFNMNPPSRSMPYESSEGVYNSSSFYPQHPHSSTLPYYRRHYGPPNTRSVASPACNINSLAFNGDGRHHVKSQNGGGGKNNNGGGYYNQGAEMDVPFK